MTARATDKLTEDEQMQVMGDTIERLLKNGVNSMRLVTDEDEVIAVIIESRGKLKPKEEPKEKE